MITQTYIIRTEYDPDQRHSVLQLKAVRHVIMDPHLLRRPHGIGSIESIESIESV